ncbi:hypothetical protein DFJ74DRAFT_664697 [Hyaloraphidium curvatum]|nr:hypothetical protein DFJ74DRAFT_664697 [Hyaloraphidium curvatum]
MEPAKDLAEAAEVAGLAPPEPPLEATENELAVASGKPADAAAAPPAGVLVPQSQPILLSNFLVHPRFYIYAANFVVFPFVSGVCYAFGECWARVMMGKWGYLPAVVGKKTGKPVGSLSDGVMREAGFQDAMEHAGVLSSMPLEGITLRSMIFGTLSGAVFGSQLVGGSKRSGGRKKSRRSKAKAEP